MSSSSRLSVDLHSASQMCGCPACLAALGLAPKTGSLAVHAATGSNTLSRGDVADLAAGARTAGLAASAAPSVPVAPAAPVAPTVTATPQAFLTSVPLLPTSSGNANVDALLAGSGYWWYSSPSAGAYPTSDGIAGIRHSLTYSFATYDISGQHSTGFAVMTPDEQQQVRSALSYISSLFDISFTEVGSGLGDINYATNDQGTASAGFSYYPDPTYPQGLGVYLNNKEFTSGSDLTLGSYGWEVLLHETGHALGLKHPGNYDSTGTNPTGPFLPLSTDNRGNTVMSYINVPASLIQIGSDTIGPISPTTYMMYDFEALQYLYGVNQRSYDASSGYAGVGTVLAKAAPTNQTFAFIANQIQYETLYAVGTNNSIDLSGGYLPSFVNLNAGTVSSIGERLTDADLEAPISYITSVHEYDETKTNANGQSETYTLFNGMNDVGIAPGAEIDTIKLGSGATTVIGNNNGDVFDLGSGSATISGGNGNDTFNFYNGSSNQAVPSVLNGGNGNDTVVINDSRSNYSIGFTSDGGVLLSSIYNGGNFTLRNIETLQFSDISFALGPNIPAPTVSARQATVSASHLQSFTFSDLFSTSVTQSNGFIRYDFYAPGTVGGQGLVELNGVPQAAGTDIVVNGNNLSRLTFVGSGTNALYGRVFDGLKWSGYTKITIAAPVDQAPVVTALTPTVMRPGTFAVVSSLFNISDAEHDAITSYDLYLPSTDGAYLSGSLSPLDSSGWLYSTTNLAYASVAAGAGHDTLYVKAFDGIAWSGWSQIAITGSNLSPVVTALSATVTASHLQSFGFSDLFTSTDPQGSAITQYDFYDADLSGTGNHGAIKLNGVAQGTGVDVIVQAGALSTLSFAATGSDALYARVYDGYTWSAYKRITITAPADQKPVVTSSALATPLRPGGSIAASALFHAADGDNDAITQYLFYDPGTAGSRVTLNQVAQAAGSLNYVAASSLATVGITAGTGSDILYVKAYDGIAWGGWAQITVTGQNLAPIVTALSTAVSAAHLQTFGFSDLFASSDPQGSAITQYDFYDADLSGTGNHGAIELNGVAQPVATDVVVAASALPSLSFVATGSDALYARVYDGYSWSAYKRIAITAPVDHAPVAVASAPAGTTADRGSAISVSTLFSVTDPDSDAPTRYRFYDAGTNGSLLEVGTTLQSVGAVVEVAAGDLGSVSMVAGKGADTLYVRAFDGVAWGGWAPVTVTGIYAAPTVTAPSATVSASHLQSFGFSDLFQAATPHGPAPTLYDFYDLDLSGTGNHGAVEVNGVAQAAGTDVVVAASALSTLSFVASGSDALYARVYDGYSWSAYKRITIAAPADQTPRVIAATSIATPRPGGTLVASTLFSTTDGDGDAITRYRFYDVGANGGRLSIGSALQSVGAVIDVAAGDLGSIGVVAGTGADTLYVKAFDGVAWGGWTAITVTGANLAPTVSALATSVSAARLQSFGFSQLFAASDPQGPAITKYDFYDLDATGNGTNGAIQVNGVSQPTATDVVVSAANLSSLSFVASGSDLLYARVFDGYSWSAYKKISVTAPVDNAPIVTTLNPSATTTYAAFSWSDEFTASDPDGDPITRYQFRDPPSSYDTYYLNGISLNGKLIDIAASDLPNLQLSLGLTSQTPVYVRAYDGLKWSNWTPLPLRNAYYVSSPPPLTISLPTLAAPLSSPLASSVAASSPSALDQISKHGIGFAAAS